METEEPDQNIETMLEIHGPVEEIPKERDVVSRLAPSSHLRSLQQILESYGKSDGKEKQTLDPNHPWMVKYQKDLNEQLLRLHKETDEQLHDLNGAINDQVKANDGIGKHMYSVQKELQQLKKSLLKYGMDSGKLQEKKDSSSKKLRETKECYRSIQEALEKERQRSVKLQKELEDVSLEVVQLKELQLDSYADSSTMKRALEKTTREREDLETEKLRQDMLINRFEIDKNRFEDKINLYKSQSAIKKEELADIRKVLNVASKDIEAIQFEKLQLMQQWNYSISSLEKRDQTGAVMRDSVRLFEDGLRTLNMDIVNHKKVVRKELEENEKFTVQLLQKDSEVAQTEKQLSDCQQRQRGLEEEYVFFDKVIQHTEQELAGLNNEKLGKEKEWQAKGKELENIMLSHRKLEERFMEAMHEKMTATKESKFNEKLIKECQKKIETLGKNTMLKGGEEARVQMKLGEAESHLRAMEETIDSLQKGYCEKEKVVAKSEAEIVKGHNLIEKKQSYILEINNKLTALIGQAGGQELGPMEREIANIKKEITSIETLRKEQEQEWLRHQRALVSLTNEASSHFKEIDKMRREEALLEAKKIRLSADLVQEERQTKNIIQNIERVQNDMTRLTAVLHREKVSEERLEQEAQMMKGDFLNMLKEAELDYMRKQNEVDFLRKRRLRLLHKLVKAENATSMWEEKLKLADEMKAILKSESHADEIANYGSEIRRLQMRWEQIDKEEVGLVGEMERAVMQYANLFVKADYQTFRGVKKKSKQYLTSKAERLRSRIVEDEKKLSNMSMEINTKNNLLFDMKKNKDEDTDLLNNLGRDVNLVAYDCESKEREKRQAIIRLSYKHKKNRLFQQVKDKKYIWAKRDMNLRSEEANRIKKNISILNTIIEPITSAEPNLKESLTSIQDHVIVSLEF